MRVCSCAGSVWKIKVMVMLGDGRERSRSSPCWVRGVLRTRAGLRDTGAVTAQTHLVLLQTPKIRRGNRPGWLPGAAEAGQVGVSCRPIPGIRTAKDPNISHVKNKSKSG